jgi:lysine biosynthesis protein LysW
MPKAFCPECAKRISLKSPRIGQKLHCPHCETALVVINLDPLDLGWADEDDD